MYSLDYHLNPAHSKQEMELSPCANLRSSSLPFNLCQLFLVLRPGNNWPIPVLSDWLRPVLSDWINLPWVLVNDDMYWCTPCISRHFWWYVLMYFMYFETFLMIRTDLLHVLRDISKWPFMQHGKSYFLPDICKLGLGLSQVEHVCISSSTQARNLSVFQTKALVWKTDMFSLVLKTKYKHVPPPPDSDLVLDASHRSIKNGNILAICQ